MNDHEPDLFFRANKQSSVLGEVAQATGKSLANGLLGKVSKFPEKEELLKKYRDGTLESVPGRILWDGLGEEAPPIFVVYKLLHEALSTTPQFFRGAIKELMKAQPERFSAVFSRETLWSVLSEARGFNAPRGLYDAERIKHLLSTINKKGIWYRSEEELEREARYILNVLETKTKLAQGFETLRLLQVEKAKSLVRGNLLLFVPAKLRQFTAEMSALGERRPFPQLSDIYATIDEIVRDHSGEGRHESIPIDILFTEMPNDTLQAVVLARTTAPIAERRELRERLLLVRYFLRLAFKGYDSKQTKVQLAFYLDQDKWFRNTTPHDSMFHEEEILLFESFWELLTGRKDGSKLIDAIRESAVKELNSKNLVSTLKTHFARERAKPENRKQGAPGESAKA